MTLPFPPQADVADRPPADVTPDYSDEEERPTDALSAACLRVRHKLRVTVEGAWRTLEAAEAVGEPRAARRVLAHFHAAVWVAIVEAHEEAKALAAAVRHAVDSAHVHEPRLAHFLAANRLQLAAAADCARLRQLAAELERVLGLRARALRIDGLRVAADTRDRLAALERHVQEMRAF
ncbi:hypothetical protein M3Y99_00940800 [Aphelenchoides fujianensis]|nr:hypothetical protein M3Y99_00940800 [Aphelenchoides fujianensis]